MRLGAYELVSEIGRGGMGSVWRARAPDGRDVAVKVLGRLGSSEARERFAREVRLLAGLGEGDGFVPLLDAGVAQGTPEGLPYLVMPLLEGGTLRDRLAIGALGVEETLELGKALGRALGRAHERGIVHRDVKPENVLFTREGRPLVSDLGLAKHFDRDALGGSQSASITRPGVMRGTALYMAPEQARDSKSAGPEADVFALGAVLWECLAGRPAFAGGTVLDVFAAIESGEVPRLRALRPEVPPWLERTLGRALASDPGRRFADGAALARALEAGAPARGRGLAIGAVALAALAIAWSARPERAKRVEGPPAAKPTESPPAHPERAKRVEGPAEARRLVGRATRLIDSRDYDEAIGLLDQALALEPGNANYLALRANARWAKGDLALGRADADRALEVDPGNVAALVTRGLIFFDRRQLDPALADFEKALAKQEHPVALAARGDIRREKGDLAGALRDADRCIELMADYSFAWKVRADTLEAKGERAGAVAALERYLTLVGTLSTEGKAAQAALRRLRR